MSGIEDFELPKAIVARLIKASLPENIAVQKDAKMAASKASTVFINYIASTANDIARRSGHKTIMGPDVFQALKALDMSDFIPHLQAEFDEYKRLAKEKKELKVSSNANNDPSADQPNPGSEGDNMEVEAEKEEENDVNGDYVNNEQENAKRRRVEDTNDGTSSGAQNADAA